MAGPAPQSAWGSVVVSLGEPSRQDFPAYGTGDVATGKVPAVSQYAVEPSDRAVGLGQKGQVRESQIPSSAQTYRQRWERYAEPLTDRTHSVVTLQATRQAFERPSAVESKTYLLLGEISDTGTATGSDGLKVEAGVLIQTRHNDSDHGVANRRQWIVRHVKTKGGSVNAGEVISGHTNHRTVALSAKYVGEHAHLSCAATAYGAQGETAGS